MKILLLAPHPFFQARGTPLSERTLLTTLTAHGHEVDVLTLHEGDDLDIPNCRILRIPKIPVDRVRPGFSAKKLACDAVMLWEALRRVRRSRYDLVHAVEESAFMALLIRRLFKVPYVYDMDSGLAQQMTALLPGLRLLFEWFEKRAVRGSVGTLAVCGALETQARAWHPKGFVACVEDVSLLTAGDPGGDALAGLTPSDWEGHPVVLYVGNLQVYQGIDLLLTAFARASREVPEARLLIVGGAPEDVERYRGIGRGLGIGECVHFAGPRPVELLGACFARATVLVSPRIRGTNTPMKVYSYLDSGRAVLATRLPTHTQVLDDEVALLAEPEPGAMARGLVRLLSDQVLRERLARNAKDFARKELTLEAYEGKLLRFYAAIEKKIGGGTAHGEIAGLEARRQGHR